MRETRVLLQTRNSTPLAASSPMAPAKGCSIWLVAPSSKKSMPRPWVTTTILVLGSAARWLRMLLMAREAWGMPSLM
ncbi:hypothetical protein D9M69_664720 [compost metagenome]